MKRIFPNLYCLTETDPRARSHSYLIVRKSGNLLLPGYVQSLAGHFEQIEELGGASLQFLTHIHDLRPEFHEEAYGRLECKLCYYKAAGSAVRKKTECPAEEFSHDGLQLDEDFEAIYFPGHTPGHSVFRWRNRGKQFLFTGHVMYFVGTRWKLNYNPTKAPKGTDFDHLASANYLFPTHSFTEEEYHTMDDHTRSLFIDAVAEAWKYPKPTQRDVF